MNKEYSIELFIIKPSVSNKIKEKVLNKLKKHKFHIVIKKDVLFSLEDMKKFYSKPKQDLIKIGESTKEYFKENKIDITSHYSNTSPLFIGKKIMERQAEYMASGKSTILITIKKGNDIYKNAKEIVGSTYPEKAKKGTIRSMSNDKLYYATIKDRAIHNIIHSSDKENVEKEIEIIKKYLKPI